MSISIFKIFQEIIINFKWNMKRKKKILSKKIYVWQNKLHIIPIQVSMNETGKVRLSVYIVKTMYLVKFSQKEWKRSARLTKNVRVHSSKSTIFYA
jgi:hypothetical protein